VRPCDTLKGASKHPSLRTICDLLAVKTLVKNQKIQYWILAGDVAWISVAMAGSYVLRYGVKGIGSHDGSFTALIPLLLVTIGLWGVVFFGMKLDGFQRGWDVPAIFSQLLLAVSFLMLAVLASGYLLQVFVSRLLLLYLGILLFVGLIAIRHGAHFILSSRYLARAVRRVLIVGDGPIGRELGNKIQRHPEMLRQVVGFLCSAESAYDGGIAGECNGTTIVQTLGVMDLLREKHVDEVIIALSRAGVSEIINLTAQCQREGIGVSVIPFPYELYLSKPQLLDIGGLPIVQLQEVRTNFANMLWKRGLDLALGLVLIVLTSPVLLLGAIALLGKKGGPLCREIRCGYQGKVFSMWRLNSDRNAPMLSAFEVLGQQLSITELPQLWNVLRGEMSLVGPRPESPERVKHYSDWQRQRLNIKPGITGLAQVHGLRQQHSSEEKTRFDLQYMLSFSPFFDISLLLQTGWTLTARVLNMRSVAAANRGKLRDNSSDYLFEKDLTGAHSTQSSAD
jgi:lipopolysaccharide/colanic/teichoic acid biosynthesis glycosyltransferase